MAKMALGIAAFLAVFAVLVLAAGSIPAQRQLDARDGTQLRVEAEGSAVGGRLTAGVVGRVAERQFRSDFQRLKQILES